MQTHFIVFLIFAQSLAACQQGPKNDQTAAADLTFQPKTVSQTTPEKAKPTATNVVFQSADGGQTWQDVSDGLPENSVAGGLFVGTGELYLRVEKKGIFHNRIAAGLPVWQKEVFIDERSTAVTNGRAGLIAFSSRGGIFQKINGTGLWLPAYTNFQDQFVRNIFETRDGNILIGCDNGLFKSADNGKTWKHVVEDGWVINMVESGGTIICTNERGILRSTDGGESWENVLSEGGVGIAVERIEGGFAAITYNTESKTRRVRTSADGGKTWQPIDAGLPPSADISSIKQVGEHFFCGHPDGIFRSSDGGKTWKLILPSIGEKVFNLSVSGNMIYAVPQNGGC